MIRQQTCRGVPPCAPLFAILERSILAEGARTEARPYRSLRSRPIERWPGRVEVFIEAAAVRFKQLLDTLRVSRRDHQSGVMKFVQTIDDLRILIRRSVRVILPGQRDDHSRIVVAMRRQLV